MSTGASGDLDGADSGQIDLTSRRLLAQRLVGPPFTTAVEAVGWLTAVQSQDYAGAKWALAQRVADVTEAEIDRLYDEGAILRTHVMRPTWHFVLPGDIGWLLELTAPRIRAGLAGRYQQLELDAAQVARAEAALTESLAGGRHRTRSELGSVLSSAGIAPDGQRLPHLIAAAELDGLVVSGPRRGKQLTFALLEERAPRARVLDRTQAMSELATRYFSSHGPAQLHDFAWWSGLTMADARAGLTLAGHALERHVVDGKEYWLGAAPGPDADAAGAIHLLPNFDEYTVAYRDRTAAMHANRPFKAELFAFGSILSNVVTVGGRVRGAWRRSVVRGRVRVEVRLMDSPKRAERRGLEEATQRYGRFLESPADLIVMDA